MLRLNIFDSRLRCHILSNAFLKSRKTDAVRYFLLSALVKSSIRPVNWAVVDRSLLKAKSSFLIKLFVSFLRRVRRRVLNIFSTVFRNEIDLLLVGIVPLFSCLGIITIHACFHGVGKCSRRM